MPVFYDESVPAVVTLGLSGLIIWKLWHANQLNLKSLDTTTWLPIAGGLLGPCIQLWLSRYREERHQNQSRREIEQEKTRTAIEGHKKLADQAFEKQDYSSATFHFQAAYTMFEPLHHTPSSLLEQQKALVLYFWCLSEYLAGRPKLALETIEKYLKEISSAIPAQTTLLNLAAICHYALAVCLTSREGSTDTLDADFVGVQKYVQASLELDSNQTCLLLLVHFFKKNDTYLMENAPFPSRTTPTLLFHLDKHPILFYLLVDFYIHVYERQQAFLRLAALLEFRIQTLLNSDRGLNILRRAELHLKTASLYRKLAEAFSQPIEIDMIQSGKEKPQFQTVKLGKKELSENSATHYQRAQTCLFHLTVIPRTKLAPADTDLLQERRNTLITRVWNEYGQAEKSPLATALYQTLSMSSQQDSNPPIFTSSST